MSFARLKDRLPESNRPPVPDEKPVNEPEPLDYASLPDDVLEEMADAGALPPRNEQATEKR